MAEQNSLSQFSVRWNPITTGCLLPLIVGAVILFGWAAVSPSLAADLSDGRRGAWIDWTREFTIGSLNIPLAAVTLYLFWMCIKSAACMYNRVALTGDEAGISCHWTLLMRPIGWADVADVTYIHNGTASTMKIVKRDGSTSLIKNIDSDGDAAVRFAAAALERCKRFERTGAP